MKNNGFLKVQAAQAAKAAQAAGRPQEIKKKSAVQNTFIFMLQVFIGMHFLAQISQMGFQRAPSGGFGSFQEAPWDTPGSVRAPRTLHFPMVKCMPSERQHASGRPVPYFSPA